MSESCEIKNLGEIKINGLSDQLHIVGADYQVGDLKQSSQVTITFIDKNGSVDSIPRSLQTPTEILFGGMSFTGYAISEERSCDPSGNNTISVTYVDGSFILDKILVGLWGKHAQTNIRTINVNGVTLKDWSRPTNYYGSNPFVIVGDFIDPCGSKDIDVKVDPCDPCPEAPLELVKQYEEEMKKIDCEQIRELQILDVEYSFLDLIKAVNSGWPPVRIQATFSIQNAATYKNTYSGTLRDVLNSWCSDYGWSYYWEDDEIKIVDLSFGVDVDLKGLDSNCDVTGISTKKSLEGTYSNSVVGYYGREGQDRDYRCNYEFGKRIVCRPLTLKDILSNDAPLAKLASGFTGVNGASPLEMSLDNYDLAEFLCMCSSYHPKIREAVAWLNAYGIVHADAADERVKNSKSIQGINGVSLNYESYHDMDYNDDLSLNKSSLPLLDMTVKRVFSSEIDPAGYDLLKNALKGDITRLLDDESAEEDDYYIFIGHMNEEKFNLRYQWEASIGNDFLGKYFIRKFDSSNGNRPQVTPAGGDSAKYYEQGDASLDFSKFFITPNPESYIEELSDENGEVSSSFIMVERNPVWTPPKEEGDSLESLIEICEDIVPKFATSVHALPDNVSLESIKNEHPDAPKEFGGWSAHDKIYLVKKYKESNSSGALQISNLTTYDHHPKDKIKEIDIDNYLTPVKIGLRSTQARKISLENTIFWMPPQSTVRESSSGGHSSETEHIPYAGGYYVFVNNNTSVETTLRIPKTEIVEIFSRSYNNNTLKNNLIPVTLDDNTIDEYYYDEIELGCAVDEGKISTAIRDYVSPLVFEQDEELEETRIEMNGIPINDFKISDGFRGMSVRFYADSPVTTLTFRNSFDIPINPDIRKQMKAKSPLFYKAQTYRNWRPPSDEYPSEGGYPTY